MVASKATARRQPFIPNECAACSERREMRDWFTPSFEVGPAVDRLYPIDTPPLTAINVPVT